MNSETLFNDLVSQNDYVGILERWGTDNSRFLTTEDDFWNKEYLSSPSAVTNIESGEIIYNERAFGSYSDFQERIIKKQWIQNGVKAKTLPENPNLIEHYSWKHLYN